MELEPGVIKTGRGREGPLEEGEEDSSDRREEGPKRKTNFQREEHLRHKTIKER